MTQLVYLAGPISALNFSEVNDWRVKVTAALTGRDVTCISPLRGKDFLEGYGTIHGGGWHSESARERGVTRRDMFDVHRASCVFVNFLNAKKVSVGTCMELAWAYRAHIPTIVVMENDNLHQHVMIKESATYVVETLEEGIELSRYLLGWEPL